MPITLDSRHDITLETARKVGWEGERLKIGVGAKAAMKSARAGFERLMANPDIVIYGVTSGYGQNARHRLDAEQRKSHARQPLWHVQAHFGAAYPERATRLMVLARLANFLGGHAAVRPQLAEAVAAMLERPLPKVPYEGAMCAGEILPLSYLFGSLAVAIEPVEKEVLALENGAPVAAALVTDGTIAATRRLDIAERVLALAAEAYMIPTGHFSPATARLWGDPHEIATTERLAGLIAGGGSKRRPYQAPVSFRVMPKMLGRLRRDLAVAATVAATSLSQVSDNPTYFPPDDGDPDGHILSTGGYHNAAAWPALNALAMAYADLVTLCDRLIPRLLDGATSGLPDQLGDGSGQSPYFGTLGFAVAGYGETARRAAQAVLMPGSESGGFVQNDLAVPTNIAWDGQETAGRMLDYALASVALVASQALHVTRRPAPPALKGDLAAIRAAAPPFTAIAPLGAAAQKIAGWIRGEIYQGKIAGVA